jgi:hypothetical protein
MEEIAWSDEVMNQLSSEFGISVADLRGEKLQLSQPAEAGWYLYADDENTETAALLSSAWAEAFVARVQADIEAGNINEYVKLEATQSKGLPTERSISLGRYLFAGSVGFLALAVFAVLFIKPKSESSVS